MKIFNKALSGSTLALAVSLTAVSTTAVHAEGFLSNLFGGSKNAAGFESMLAHVPADTSYLLANKKAIPEEVMEYHLKRGKDMLAMFSKAQAKKDADDKTDDSAKESADAEKFFSALMTDYSDLLANDKFEETGLSKKANSMIYGYD